MKFIQSKYEILDQKCDLMGIYKQIELAARTSYKSENRITDDSAQRMVDSLIKNGHFSCLEHGTIYLQVPYERVDVAIHYQMNPYCKSTVRNGFYYITTNARVIVEHNWQDDLVFMCEPTEYHEIRVSVRFTASIGTEREIMRHRAFSFIQESTRYCNYSKEKFGSELTFIIPEWIYKVQSEIASYPDPLTRDSRDWLMQEKGEDLIDSLCCFDRSVASWYDCLEKIEEDYNYLTTTDESYKLAAQEARGILPLDLKADVVMTGFVSDWIHFFQLRSYIAATGKPHPDLQILADGLLLEFLDKKYIENEDLKKGISSESKELFS